MPKLSTTSLLEELNLLEELKRKIATRQAVVGVVGLGYVGLPFAVEKAKVRFRVMGVE